MNFKPVRPKDMTKEQQDLYTNLSLCLERWADKYKKQNAEGISMSYDVLVTLTVAVSALLAIKSKEVVSNEPKPQS